MKKNTYEKRENNGKKNSFVEIQILNDFLNFVLPNRQRLNVNVW